MRQPDAHQADGSQTPGHPWDLAPSEAVALQHELAQRLLFEPYSGPLATIAGIDVSVRGDRAHAAIVVLSYPSLDKIDQAAAFSNVSYPYVPGLLTFREAPAILRAWEGLKMDPDLLMFDGQGYAHPRRLGLASHLGLLLGKPAIGCAKSCLCGQYEQPGIERGAYSDMIDGGEIVGAAVRTRTAVRPVFVSAGHLISLSQAIALTLETSRRYRLPEPTRQAHQMSVQWLGEE